MRTRNKLPLPQPTDSVIEIWSIYNGHMRIYLVGPGHGEWWPLTAPNSSLKKHGTAKELEIARQAVQHLNRHHPERGTSFSCIRKVLENLGWEPDEFTKYPSDEKFKSPCEPTWFQSEPEPT